MDRLWLATALVAVATGARGEEVEWRPASPAPLTAPPPVPAPAPVAAPEWTPPPAALPRAVAPSPPATPTDAPEFHAVVPSGSPPAPAPPADAPRELPLPRVPVASIPASADAASGPGSQPLPQPRPLPVPAEPTPPPAASPTWTVNPAAGVGQFDARPTLEPAPHLPGRTLGGVPVRHNTFGSPTLQLSRDFALRDLFGTDLAATKTGPLLPGLAASGGPPTDDFFVETEYLLWWANRPRIPLLATTSSGTGPGSEGFVGQPRTIPLLGPGTFGPSLRDGFRVRAGGWLGEASGHGFDASFFFLGRRTESRRFDGFATLARPFFAPNPILNGEFGEQVAFPNGSSGSLLVAADSFLWGADFNYRCATCRSCDRTTAWFAGYRHLNLTESLTITEFITATGPLVPDPAGTFTEVQDRFRTTNRFHGGQVGWTANRRFGRWELDLRASVALGVTVQMLEIDGFQSRTRPGQDAERFAGGLLATGPNLGRFDRSRFSVVPEATATLGYAVTPRLRLSVGYNFLYWNNVIRPGDQIDRVVDVLQVPNFVSDADRNRVVFPIDERRPIPLFRQSDFWTQGVTFGAQLRW